MKQIGRERRTSSIDQAHLAKQIEETLLQRHGLILGGSELARVLGYPTLRAFQQATLRRVVGVPVFTIENRRGRFALASDVAEWLAKQRSRAEP
jgi:hypothetical protein